MSSDILSDDRDRDRVRRARRWGRFLVPVLILAISGGVFAGLVATREISPPAEVEEKSWLVQTQEIQPGSFAPDLLLYGRVEAHRVAALTAAVNAYVAAVPVREGYTVERGETLVRLDDEDLRLVLRQRVAELAEVEASITTARTRHAADRSALTHEQRLLELARREVDRVRDLLRRKLGSQSQLDQAEQAVERQAMAVISRRLAVDEFDWLIAEWEARKARISALRDQAQLDLERAHIVAPFAGRIIRVHAAVGDRVRPGEELVEMFDESTVEIRAQLPTRNLPAIRRAVTGGTELRARAAIDGVDQNLVLDRLAAAADPGSGGLDAFFRGVSDDSAATMGRVVRVVLRLPEIDGTVELPHQALYGLDRVYKLEDGRMTAVDVERVGERRHADGRASVLVRSAELKSGDRIVTTQLPNAVQGLKVREAVEG